MLKIKFSVIFILSSIFLSAQSHDSIFKYRNSADKLLSNSKEVSIGGYGQIDYNQVLNSSEFNNGTLDIHRLVLLFGYHFNDRLKFVSEIEFEHVKEVYVEQSFVQYKLNHFIDLRGGLILIPMGIVNEYHEPPTFNGVERPATDKYIIPSTWRELGFGLSGNVIDASLKYQLYLVNGFNGYDGNANLNGKYGLRKARQKGAESYISSPNFSGKVEYYGIRGLNVGFSTYFGKTQSTAYQDVAKNDFEAIKSADSTVVGISMTGLDLRYQLKGFALRGQFTYNKLKNTNQYNEKLSSDLGNEMLGWYAEFSYDVLSKNSKLKSMVIPFIRYEFYDTHFKTDSNLLKNDAYNKSYFTTGLSWKITPQIALKTDYQFYKSKNETDYSQMFNFGIGFMF